MQKRITCVALSTLLLFGVFVQQVTAVEGLAALEQQAAQTEEIATGEQIFTLDDLNAEQQDNELEEGASIQEDSKFKESNPEQGSQETASDADIEEIPEGPFVLVDGTVVEDAAPLLHEQTTYVSLRSISLALRPDAVVSWSNGCAIITADGLSVTVYPEKSYVVANGRYLYLPNGVLFENGSTMLPVRMIAQIFDAQVYWNAEDGNISLTSGSGAILSGDVYYDADDLCWLSRIIYAESGNQPLEGKIGVGNVVLNRVNSPVFPNTIYDVIFQANQFTPVGNGSVFCNPNEESIIAAKLCLDGAVVLPSALWFNRAGTSSWASRNKTFVETIGAHSFFA